MDLKALASAEAIIAGKPPRSLLTAIDRHAGLLILSYLSPVSLAAAMRASKKWVLPAHNSLWKAHCLADSIPGVGVAASGTGKSSSSDSKTATPAVVVPDRHFHKLYCQFGGMPITRIDFDEATHKALTEYKRINGQTEFSAFRVRGGPSVDPASVTMYTHRLAVFCSLMLDTIPKRAAGIWNADQIVSVGIHATRYHRTVRLFTVLSLFACDSHMQLYGDGRYARTLSEYDDPKHPNHLEARRIRDGCSQYNQGEDGMPRLTATQISEAVQILKAAGRPKTKPACNDEWPDPTDRMTALDML